MNVFITGVAGSGKSTLAHELKRRGYASYDIEAVPDLFTMYDKETGNVLPRHNNSDLELVKRGDWTCNKTKLSEIIRAENNNPSFYCGTASNILEILDLFDKTFVLVASNSNTIKRLNTRTSGQFGHTHEVQQWIMTWKEHAETEVLDKGGIVIDANRNISDVVKEILSRV